jgi:hypothetical protein
MTPADIETFLKVKRQIVWTQRVQIVVAVLALVGLTALLLFRQWDDATANMVWGIALGAAMFSAGARGNVPRDRLIELLERQINRDPNALRYLAETHPAR